MFALNICCIASLVPAYKKKIRVNTDDGSVCIYLRGDENCKFAVSEMVTPCYKLPIVGILLVKMK